MKKLYSIEFVRVYFLCFIILIHTSVISSFDSVSTFAYNIFHSLGSRVDIFMLICGFFLYRSLEHRNPDFLTVLKHRAKRILPALLCYKLLVMLFLNEGTHYFLTNLMILNKNIGISLPTISHVIWYVDVMFWSYLFYSALFIIFDKKKSFFTTALIMFVCLMLLFTSSNVNLHFEMLNQGWIDGGVLRCLAFMGMGILLSGLPVIKNENKSYIMSIVEICSLIMLFIYPGLVKHDSGMVLNHVLWAVIFIYLAVGEYGFFLQWLNKQAWINHISKYCYEIYVFQYFAILLGQKYFLPILSPWATGGLIVVLSFFLGFVFKDFIEPAILRLIKR